LADNIVVSDEITHFPFSSLTTQEHMCIMFTENAWIGVSNLSIKAEDENFIYYV